MTKKDGIYKHKSVSLSQDERQIVKDLAARLNLTFSSALRIIIRQWANDREEVATSKNIFHRLFSPN